MREVKLEAIVKEDIKKHIYEVLLINFNESTVFLKGDFYPYGFDEIEFIMRYE